MIETITQDLSALGTSGANKVLARRKVLSLSTSQLDKRLKNGEVQRRFKRFMDKGLPTGAGKHIPCDEATALEEAINQVFLAPGTDYNPADGRPYQSFCVNPAVMARFKRFNSGKDSALRVDRWVGSVSDVAKLLRSAEKDELAQLLTAELAGRNDTGSARTVVTDAIIEALAAKGADGRSAADKTGVSDEDRAAMIADEE